jgi:hypothetical protein
MKNDAGVSRLGVLFGITLAALIAHILWDMRPNPRWDYPIHIVFQSIDEKNLPGSNIGSDPVALERALRAIPPDPQHRHLSMYNVRWDGKPFATPSPPVREAKGSDDTDGGAADGMRPNSHVTQQVSFQTAQAMQTFLESVGVATTPTPSP